jgi:four helix bundle protein
MPLAKSFRELKTYQHALDAAEALFHLTRSFPKEETYSLIDQVRRSSRAVSALIAEAWARRRYQAAFVEKLSQSLAECMETQAWLDHAKICSYLGNDQYAQHNEQWQQIGGMISRMIERSADFCASSKSSTKP